MLMQKSFQAIEQKLVQRCETKVDADACKASYCLDLEKQQLRGGIQKYFEPV